MGAQWKAKGKAQVTDARGKLFGKLAKEIMVAARGGADPAGNSRLRLVVEQARKVSMPKDKGVTSRRSTSFTSPPRTPPWMAAPTATTSSGLTPLWGSLWNNSLTFCCTLGMRVMPPTRMTSLMS